MILLQLATEMEMGSFYAKKIAISIRMTHSPTVLVVGNPDSERLWKETRENDKRDYLLQIEKVRDQAIDLVIELLRYQNWK